MDWNLEVVVVPVSDVDRSRNFYENKLGNEWQAFTLEQFFCEDEEVEYALKDAQEIYHP